MKKTFKTKHRVGSVNYVIAHAKWQKSRGRNPSEPLKEVSSNSEGIIITMEKNPKKALAKAMAYLKEYTISGKTIILDTNEAYSDFYLEDGNPQIDVFNFEKLLEALQSREMEVNESLRELLLLLNRWTTDAPRKRFYRNLKRKGMHVLSDEYFFEADGGELIIDTLENTGIFVNYLLRELYGEKAFTRCSFCPHGECESKSQAKQEILERIVPILIEELSLDEGVKITLETTLKGDLDETGPFMLQVLFKIGLEFKIKIDSKEFFPVRNLDLMGYVENGVVPPAKLEKLAKLHPLIDFTVLGENPTEQETDDLWNVGYIVTIVESKVND